MTAPEPDPSSIAPADTVPGRRGGIGGALATSLLLPRLRRRTLVAATVAVILIWGLSGVYRVQPDESGIVLRFGRAVETSGPGLHMHWPFPIEMVLLPKVTTINQLVVGRSEASDLNARSNARNRMLTGDENIVEAEGVIYWRIKDAARYLFAVADPAVLIKMTAESAMREVIGRNPIQAALSDRRQQIAEQIEEELQRLLDLYDTGVQVTQVQLQRIDPPFSVIDAFNDVQRARADQERARNEAQAYRNDILPRARGEVERIRQEAEAYRTQAINAATGEIQGFEAIRQSYRRAPEITAWRFYLDSVDEVLRHAGRVVIDSSGHAMSSVVPVMPLADAKVDTKAAASGGQGGGK